MGCIAVKKVTGKMKKIAEALRVAAYLMAVTLVFWAVSVLCAAELVLVHSTEPGVTDLTEFDFENSIAQVATESTDSIFMYPGAFYTPEDFASGGVAQEGVLYRRQPGGQGEYGTLRMVLKLPPNETYAIAGKSVSYAQRLFIDGKEYAAIGTPGDSIEKVTPSGRRFIEGISPTGDSTEIIFHYSAFVHFDGGGLYPMNVGLVRSIARAEQLSVLRDTAVAMTLMTAALFFFGLHLFSPRGRILLWFALACLSISVRTSYNLVALLLPGLNWYCAIRLEYILTCGVALFAALYLSGLFPGAAHRWATRGFAMFCAANTLFICMAHPVVFTRYAVAFGVAYAAFGVYLLIAIIVALVRKKITSPLSKTERWLFVFALFVYAAFSAVGVWAHQWAVVLMGLDYPVVGMMIFLFLNILALALGFTRTERALDEARRAEREMEETNRTLMRLNRVRAVFLSNLSHELKTPLAGIGNMAEYTRAKMHSGTWDAEADGNLESIIERSEWLTAYVNRLLHQALEQEDKLDFAAVPARALLDRAAEIARPLLRERNNRLALAVDGEMPPVSGVEDMLLRVLLNLIGNANRHSEGGEIAVTASAVKEPMSGMAEIRVTDRGSGIPDELMPQIFYRGISGDGGSGLGLTICKDIVETHGGVIHISSEPGGGTEVWFTIPLAKE